MHSLKDVVNIPRELQLVPQWLVAAPNKRPLKNTGFDHLADASINDPSCFLTFDRACELAAIHSQPGTQQYGIGFVLTAADPYTIIDLDDKASNPATAADHELFKAIISTMASYSELSSSGRGAHIIVRASVTSNFRRGHVECYSSRRFMILTGNRFGPQDLIMDRSEIIENMVSRMSLADKPEDVELDDQGKERLGDKNLYMMCSESAANKDKFNALWKGEIATDSQSESDSSLMQMLWFYSRNKVQTVRMFMWSALGQREKAKRKDYVVRTLAHAINKLEKDEMLRNAITFEESFLGAAKPKGLDPEITMRDIKYAVDDHILQETKEAGVTFHLQKEIDAALNELDPVEKIVHKVRGPAHEVVDANPHLQLPTPVGKLAALVDYFDGVATNPTREFSLLAAIAFITGIAGNAYKTPTQTGLNQYFILVSKSGTGKESMRTGISKLSNVLKRAGCPVDYHFDFTEYGSPQSLMAQGILLAKANSFLHVSGEWGMAMKSLAGSSNAERAAGYQRIQLQMYMASNVGYTVQGHKLQNKENSASERGELAYSILSETNPHDFSESFSAAMGDNGFMSRITAIEYLGVMPARNKNLRDKPTQEVIDHIKELEKSVQKIGSQLPTDMLNATHVGSMTVGFTPEAYALADQFQDECDDTVRRFQRITTGAEDFRQHLYTRLNLKVLRLACLLAVYENPAMPVAELWMVQWAIAFMKHSMSVFQTKIATGEIGSSYNKAFSKLLYTFQQYCNRKYIGADVDPVLVEQGIIKRTPLWVRVKDAFLTNGSPDTRQFDGMMNEYEKLGRIQKLTDMDKQAYAIRGDAWRILDVSRPGE